MINFPAFLGNISNIISLVSKLLRTMLLSSYSKSELFASSSFSYLHINIILLIDISAIKGFFISNLTPIDSPTKAFLIFLIVKSLFLALELQSYMENSFISSLLN